MPKQLNQVKFLPVNFIPVGVLTDSTNGNMIDTKVTETLSYDTAFVSIQIGELGNQASTKVKIQEADSENFSDATTARGGEEITVGANSSNYMQIERTKRYLRAVVTLGSGTSKSVQIYVGGILWNAAVPFPM